ncbi:MAG: hypothetical protein Kow0092_26830 [Deferrisomatales bacterium]
MGKPLCLLFVAVAFLLRPALGSGASSRQAFISGVHLQRGEAGDLVVGFQVEGVLTERIRETLDSGLPVRFTYWMRVEHPRHLAADDVLVDRTLERVLEKDNLKNRYRLTLEDGRAREVASLFEALGMLTRVSGVSLMPAEVLAARRPLILRLKVRLQKFKLPFRLHYLFAFVAYWDVETEWYVMTLPGDPDRLP